MAHLDIHETSSLERKAHLTSPGNPQRSALLANYTHDLVYRINLSRRKSERPVM